MFVCVDFIYGNSGLYEGVCEIVYFCIFKWWGYGVYEGI